MLFLACLTALKRSSNFSCPVLKNTTLLFPEKRTSKFSRRNETTAESLTYEYNCSSFKREFRLYHYPSYAFLFVIIAMLGLAACQESKDVEKQGVTETPEARVTAVPEATVTPEPTATPVPTATPEPTATPVPTATPLPEGVVELSDAKVGATVLFGSYEQDNKTGNGAEKIQWYVLDRKGDEVLLFSKYLLDVKAFHSDYVEYITWEECTLRTWLNNDFYNTAFTDDEKAIIKLSKLTTNGNNFYKSVGGGNDTEDNIFVLSTNECRDYFLMDTSSDMGWKSEDDRLLAEKTKYTFVLTDSYVWRYLFKTDFKLGIITAVFNFVALLTNFLFAKYASYSKFSILISISFILACCGTALFVLMPDKATFIFYNFCCASAVKLFDLTAEVNMFNTANIQVIKRRFKTEYFALREIFLNIGRIVSFSILLLFAMCLGFGGLKYFILLLLFFYSYNFEIFLHQICRNCSPQSSTRSKAP
mgnify:CR=1 FL=1